MVETGLSAARQVRGGGGLAWSWQEAGRGTEGSGLSRVRVPGSGRPLLAGHTSALANSLLLSPPILEPGEVKHSPNLPYSQGWPETQFLSQRLKWKSASAFLIKEMSVAGAIPAPAGHTTGRLDLWQPSCENEATHVG